MIGHQLDLYLSTVAPFNWETNNCCQYALGWLRFRSSPDEVSGFQHVTRFKVARLVHEYGGLEGLVSHFLDRSPTPVTQLQIGDLVRVRDGHTGHSIGILAGRTVAVLTLRGVGHDRVTSDLTGWKIK